MDDNQKNLNNNQININRINEKKRSLVFQIIIIIVFLIGINNGITDLIGNNCNIINSIMIYNSVNIININYMGHLSYFLIFLLLFIF